MPVMRSFRADPERERDLLEIRQTRLPDGAFISAEHGLKIQLTDEWNAVNDPDFLLPGTAFALEKDQGRCMIQLLCTFPLDAGDSRGLLDWLLTRQGTGDAAAEPRTVTLEILSGTEAWITEVDDFVIMLNVAFVYQGYGYYGLFMWIAQEDAQARPFLLEALRTISVPE